MEARVGERGIGGRRVRLTDLAASLSLSLISLAKRNVFADLGGSGSRFRRRRA